MSLPFSDFPPGTTDADIDRLMEPPADDNPWVIDEPESEE